MRRCLANILLVIAAAIAVIAGIIDESSIDNAQQTMARIFPELGEER